MKTSDKNTNFKNIIVRSNTFKTTPSDDINLEDVITNNDQQLINTNTNNNIGNKSQDIAASYLELLFDHTKYESISLQDKPASTSESLKIQDLTNDTKQEIIRIFKQKIGNTGAIINQCKKNNYLKKITDSSYLDDKLEKLTMEIKNIENNIIDLTVSISDINPEILRNILRSYINNPEMLIENQDQDIKIKKTEIKEQVQKLDKKIQAHQNYEFLLNELKNHSENQNNKLIRRNNNLSIVNINLSPYLLNLFPQITFLFSFFNLISNIYSYITKPLNLFNNNTDNNFIKKFQESLNLEQAKTTDIAHKQILQDILTIYSKYQDFINLQTKIAEINTKLNILLKDIILYETVICNNPTDEIHHCVTGLDIQQWLISGQIEINDYDYNKIKNIFIELYKSINKYSDNKNILKTEPKKIDINSDFIKDFENKLKNTISLEQNLESKTNIVTILEEEKISRDAFLSRRLIIENMLKNKFSIKENNNFVKNTLLSEDDFKSKKAIIENMLKNKFSIKENNNFVKNTLLSEDDFKSYKYENNPDHKKTFLENLTSIAKQKNTSIRIISPQI